MAPMCVCVCLITDLEWVTPERSIAHYVCVCTHIIFVLSFFGTVRPEKAPLHFSTLPLVYVGPAGGKPLSLARAYSKQHCGKVTKHERLRFIL